MHGRVARAGVTAAALLGVRTLFRFPLVVWAAMVRFGPRREAPPPIAPGEDFLIRNTAALLHHGGHSRRRR